MKTVFFFCLVVVQPFFHGDKFRDVVGTYAYSEPYYSYTLSLNTDNTYKAVGRGCFGLTITKGHWLLLGDRIRLTPDRPVVRQDLFALATTQFRETTIRIEADDRMILQAGLKDHVLRKTGYVDLKRK